MLSDVWWWSCLWLFCCCWYFLMTSGRYWYSCDLPRTTLGYLCCNKRAIPRVHLNSSKHTHSRVGKKQFGCTPVLTLTRHHCLLVMKIHWCPLCCWVNDRTGGFLGQRLQNRLFGLRCSHCFLFMGFRREEFEKHEKKSFGICLLCLLWRNCQCQIGCERAICRFMKSVEGGDRWRWRSRNEFGLTARGTLSQFQAAEWLQWKRVQWWLKEELILELQQIDVHRHRCTLWHEIWTADYTWRHQNWKMSGSQAIESSEWDFADLEPSLS